MSTRKRRQIGKNKKLKRIRETAVMLRDENEEMEERIKRDSEMEDWYRVNVSRRRPRGTVWCRRTEL